MATRWFRLAQWQHRRSLRRQATAQEAAAGHPIGLAGILTAMGPKSVHRWPAVAGAVSPEMHAMVRPALASMAEQSVLP